MQDLEKRSSVIEVTDPKDPAKNGDISSADSVKAGHLETHQSPWLRKLMTLGVELRGIFPVPVEERADLTGRSLISLWFTANCSLLPIATGMAGTLSYGLSLRVASLVILFFGLLAGIPVAWMGMMGPKTGMRQMIQARYSFGLYLISVVIVLQLATLTGYTIIGAIVSGQTLSAISGDSLSLTVGIVIAAAASLVVSFMGYKVLHLYEKWSWIPTLAAIIITVGFGGSKLSQQAETAIPTARVILSFGSIIMSFTLSWSPLVSDFAVYVSPDVPRSRVFSYVYVGLVPTTILLLTLGAAIGGAIPSHPSWTEGYATNSTGGVMFAMLENAGGFGKFIAVILAFSVIGNIACSLYSLSINFQVVLPILVRVPRYVFSILITAIVIPVSIVIASNFLSSLNNFLGIIGYWAAVFIGITLTEHHYFRGGNPDAYDVSIWDVGNRLPIGAAALLAGALSFGLIIPCMDAAWFVGPIALHTGDLGVEVGLCLSVLLYIPLRTFEKSKSCR